MKLVLSKANSLFLPLRQKNWSRNLININIPIILMGLLLGRAMILESVSPFAFAYLGVLLFLSRKQWPMVMTTLIIGAATIGLMHATRVAIFLLLVLAVYRLFKWIGKDQINYAPFIVGLSGTIGHTLYIQLTGWSWYQGLLSSIEIVLSFILTLIFVHCLPLFTVRRKRISLRTEEVVCLVILLGSVITGTIGWTIWDMSIVHVISRYLIILLAFVGGAMLGTSMGVVTGIILSLSDTKAMLQIGLLAFAGLMAGLFKEGRKAGVCIGFLLGSSIMALYNFNAPEMWISIQESLMAALLFILTPDSFSKQVSRFVPGTTENQLAHQEYMRRLRDVTATKVEQFTELFQELAVSFRENKSKLKRENDEQVVSLMSNVVNQSCTGCEKYTRCWEQNVMHTYQGMTDLMAYVEVEGPKQNLPVPEAWNDYCVRGEHVLERVQDQYLSHEETSQWNEKIRESRRIVSEQLTGLSEVMSNLSREIRHEIQVLSAQEDHIHESLEELGLSIQRVDIINLEEGKVEIEVLMPHRDGLDECKKLVAPLLSEVLGEPITVFRKVVNDRTEGALITLGSAQHYELKTGVAIAAKGGEYISGDSYCYMNLGTGKYAIAISDGMGNGGRAQEESHAALNLMRKLLQAGMNEDRTVETVNSILSLRSTDEMFATIDLAMIDMNTADSKFMKIGSTPGFIKRGKDVLTICAPNPPVGILNNIEIEPIEMQLFPGDLLVMMTDGVYESPSSPNKDAFMARLIAEIDTKDPQGFADSLLEQVVSQQNGKVEDDMTVVVSKIERYTPEWSTISLPGIRPMKRPQIVS